MEFKLSRTRTSDCDGCFKLSRFGGSTTWNALRLHRPLRQERSCRNTDWLHSLCAPSWHLRCRNWRHFLLHLVVGIRVLNKTFVMAIKL